VEIVSAVTATGASDENSNFMRRIQKYFTKV